MLVGGEYHFCYESGQKSHLSDSLEDHSGQLL